MPIKKGSFVKGEKVRKTKSFDLHR